MRHILSIAALVVISACSIPMGGTGQSSSGDAVIGEVVLNSDQKNQVKISSLAGWNCTGQYERDTTTAVRQFPLTCSNGLSGTGILTVNAPTAYLEYQRATLTYQLSNGEKGTVQFGLLS